MATLASGGARASGRGSGEAWVAALVGAALYGFFNLVAFEIQIPGAQDVSIRPHYGLLTFFGFAFGPWVGLFTGLVGNALGDTLTGYGTFTSWHWSVANGLVGLIAGSGMVIFRARAGTSSSRAVASAIVAIIATAIGFGFIWIELLMPGQGGAGTILGAEYVPVVIGNSIAAAIMTPILVLAWTPLEEHLLH